MYIFPNHITGNTFSLMNIGLGFSESLNQFLRGATQYEMNIQKGLLNPLILHSRMAPTCVLILRTRGNERDNTNH
jgi:hypothetical protein